MSRHHLSSAATMLPPEAAPAREVGPVRWVRENLFSGWLNTLLTLLRSSRSSGCSRISGPWFAHAVWNAGSLTECRQIIAERWGEGAGGACFAVIRERWKQFLFGFYPTPLYWRPTLAFLLMFVALAPVLFSGAPRRLLWFSLAFPGVAYWLLWGGSIFVPLAIYAGFAVGYLVVTALIAPRFGSLLAHDRRRCSRTLIWWLYLAGPVAGVAGVALPFLSLQPVASKQFGGFMLSIIIGMTGIAFSLPLGILLALGRRSDMFFVKSICVGFIEFIRGVPLITLLLVASFLLNIFLPPGTNFDIILRVIIMVTLFSAAYMAEIDPRRARGAAARPVRGGRRARARLLEVDAAHHHAAGAEDLDPGIVEQLHRPVQGHDARRDHRAVRPDRPRHLDPRRLQLERHRLGALRLRRR